MIDRDAIGNLDQVATAVPSVVADGPAAGCRALDLRAWNGIDVRLLPDRALDAGAAWFRGVPLAWISPVGEHAPIDNPRELDWLRAFGGGLVVTCGLRNVGAPSEGHGQHGELTMQRAHVLAVERSERAISVRARVAEVSALGFHLELERTWTTHVGEGRLTLVDVVRNRGREDEPAPQLYHVNLGAPVWSEGAALAVDTTATHPRDEAAAPYAGRWRAAPGVVLGAQERVFEHEVAPGPDGWGSATVTSPAAGIEVTVRWDLATLPRLWQWVHPAPGMGVLGIEPANCSVLGRAADRAAGRLPVLRAGEARTTRLEILARALQPAPS
jgi:hypothetical protein